MAYVHGTEPREHERLALLNRLTNAAFISFLDIGPRMRVLEVGSGLGILAAEVAAAAPGVEVTGLEISSEQIRAAVQMPSVRYVQGDAQAMQFENESFDLIYARYLLEHVLYAGRVVLEMSRVVRVGGRVAACENDISLLRIDPPCPVFSKVWRAFERLQKMMGGDPLIGRRLHRLFRRAGFSHIELSIQPELHWYGSPGFAGWIENLVGNIEGARSGLVDAGEVTQRDIDAAVGELRALLEDRDASCQFLWNRVMAVR
jgi:ubiquinone/menaquinone biosynthesis C-methylase UbiE